MGVSIRLALALCLALAPMVVPGSAYAAKPSVESVRYNNKGVDLFTSGKFDKAIEAYNEAIRLNPKYTEAYSNRGAAFDAMNNPERAVQDYTAAIALNPKLTAAYSNRAAAHMDLGDFKAALADWNVVIGRSPKDAFAYNGRGSCYKSLGDLAMALKDFEKAVNLKPGYTKAIKNRDAVKKSLATTVVEPDAVGARFTSPAQQPVQPSPHQPSPAQQRSVAATPCVAGNAKPSPIPMVTNVFHHLAGNALFALGQYQGAASQYSSALVDNQRDAYAYFRRAKVREREGAAQEAVADYQAALAINPRLYTARKQLNTLTSKMQSGGAAQ